MTSTRFAALGLAAAMTTFLSACKPRLIDVDNPPPAGGHATPQAVYNYDHKLQPGVKEAFANNKPVVALLRTGDFTEFADALPFGRERVVTVPGLIGDRAVIAWRPEAPVIQERETRQFLMQELVASQCLTVVERERVIQILREQAFAASQPDATRTPPRKGRMFGARCILEAACFPPGSPPAVDSSWAQLDRLLSPTPRTACNMWAVYLNAYDTETGEIKAVGYGSSPNQLMACRRAVNDMLRQLAKSLAPPSMPRKDVDY